MNTIYLSIAFFAFAALIGMYLLSYVLKGTNPPKSVAFIHGPLAVVGLIMLIAYCVNQQVGFTVPIVLFSIAAAGGLLMITLHLTGKKIPKWIAMGHGLIAVTGFIALLVVTF